MTCDSALHRVRKDRGWEMGTAHFSAAVISLPAPRRWVTRSSPNGNKATLKFLLKKKWMRVNHAWERGSERPWKEGKDPGSSSLFLFPPPMWHLYLDQCWGWGWNRPQASPTPTQPGNTDALGLSGAGDSGNQNEAPYPLQAKSKLKKVPSSQVTPDYGTSYEPILLALPRHGCF